MIFLMWLSAPFLRADLLEMVPNLQKIEWRKAIARTMLGRHLVWAWVGGAWNGRFQESEKESSKAILAGNP